MLPDGAVEATFKPEEDYPFAMKAVFRLAAPDAIDVETIVTANKDLPRSRSFYQITSGRRIRRIGPMSSTPCVRPANPTSCALIPIRW